MKEDILDFFSDLWKVAATKHDQGIYNTVCLVVLLALPMVVLFTSLVVCCHCCCRRANSTSCCGDSPSSDTAKSDKKKKKSSKNEDLWISVKTGPMTPDRVALTMV
uniref:KIAA0040 n=1 Tax=Hucho hucho TaxID=62062 RepID=A0A4W5PXG1_9TELE